MLKEQIVGVVFLSSEDRMRAQGDACKEYLYRDTLGCKVGEIVVVEARDSVSLARIASIYVDTIALGDKALRNVVSRVESSYTKKKKELEVKRLRLSTLETALRDKCAEAGWYETFKAMAQSNAEIAVLFGEYDKLRTEVEHG